MRSHSLTFMLVGAAACGLWGGTEAGVFTVTSRFDVGANTLRQAITDANAAAQPAIINFNIVGDGAQTITLSSALPDITVPTVIDGTTQPGFAGAPLIVLDGNQRAIPAALRITAGGSTVRSLIINNVGKTDPGDGIVLTGPGGNTITGCWLGVDSTGNTTRRIRGDDIHIINSPNNHIGGVTAAERNVISGSGSFAGVHIEGPDSTGNQVSGNFIGLDVSGSVSHKNIVGLLIDGAPINVIGGPNPGARNVISGNFLEEVKVTGITATGNVIEGNFVGLKADGTALNASGSSENGIVISGAPGNVIGGRGPGAGNVIANVNIGIQITDVDSKQNAIQGNRIGTDPTGLHAIANGTGIRISSGASQNSVGGTEPGMRNLISGNRTYGVAISDASGNVIQGNFVGTDASGNAALPNGIAGASSSGISVASISGPAENNLIGGHLPGPRNVISGNNDEGVTLVGDVRHTTIAGNYVGLGANGATVLGNAGIGVAELGASENTIGGSDDGDANWIVGNGGPNKNPGVFLGATFGSVGTPGTGNVVLKNFIGQNTGPGVTLFFPNQVSQNTFFGTTQPIDRFGDGPTPNTDKGPGNSPDIGAVEEGGGVLGVSGNLSAAPNCGYDIEPYLVRPVGVGPFAGPSFIPIVKTVIHVQTLPSGAVDFGPDPVPFATLPGDKITGLAFAALCGDGTSEFGPAVVIKAPEKPSIAIARPAYTVNEGAGSVTINLIRAGDVSSGSSVRFSTSLDDSGFYGKPAAAGTDYVPVDRVVSFQPDQVSAGVVIEIKKDDAYTGAKVFRVKLTQPENAVLASSLYFPPGTAMSFALVSIQDDDQPKGPVVLELARAGNGGVEAQVIEPVAEAVVLQSASLGESQFGWETAAVIPSGQTKLDFTPGQINEALRAVANWGVFLAAISVTAPDGLPATDLKVQLGTHAPAISADQLPPSQPVPAGPVEIVVSKETSTTDPVSGQPVHFVNSLEAMQEIVDSFKAIMKADIQVEKPPRPACLCTPWAGAVGGTIGGVQKVVIGGGKNGQCDKDAVVHITGPGGVDVTLTPDKKGRYRKSFEPAADGEWTVTSTVCDKTTTAKISLP